MGRKGLVVLAVVGGASLVSLAVAADVVGLGPRGFGLEQKLGVAAGSAVAWFGMLHLAGWSPRSGRAGVQAKVLRSAAPTAGA